MKTKYIAKANVPTPPPPPPPPSSISEERLAEIIRKVVKEEIKQEPTDVGSAVENALNKTVGGLMTEIRDRINSVGPQADHKEPAIDPHRLAEISQKSVERLSEDIETSGSKNTKKKIQIINADLKNLANEL